MVTSIQPRPSPVAQQKGPFRQGKRIKSFLIQFFNR
jgi:hypothetical protein